MPITREVLDEIAAGRAVFAPLVSTLKGEPSGETMEEARAAYLAVKARQPAPSGVFFAPVDLGGVPGLTATPDTMVEDRVLFYMHGGGYMSGGSEASKAEVGRLARGARFAGLCCGLPFGARASLSETL